MLAPVIERFRMTAALHAIAERMRVLILVSKFGHCLNDLLYRHRVGALAIEIPAIVSNHRDFYRLARVDYQLIVSAPAPRGGMISVVLNRHRRDFSDQQREVIDLLRPHLRQAAAIAALLSQPVPYTPRHADGRPLLTPQQTRILQLVAAGSSDRSVARVLGLSVRTVQAHLQHIYRTLGVTSRTEALANVRALSLGGASASDRK